MMCVRASEWDGNTCDWLRGYASVNDTTTSMTCVMDGRSNERRAKASPYRINVCCLLLHPVLCLVYCKVSFACDVHGEKVVASLDGVISSENSKPFEAIDIYSQIFYMSKSIVLNVLACMLIQPFSPPHTILMLLFTFLVLRSWLRISCHTYRSF